MMVLKHLIQNICISKETNKIMGVRITGILQRTDPPVDTSKIKDEKFLTAYEFVTQKDEEVDVLNRLGVDEVMNFFGLGVVREFRRKGIATKLLNAAVAFAKELGIKGIKGMGSSCISQKIFEKAGFETAITIPYNSYVTFFGRKD